MPAVMVLPVRPKTLLAVSATRAVKKPCVAPPACVISATELASPPKLTPVLSMIVWASAEEAIRAIDIDNATTLALAPARLFFPRPAATSDTATHAPCASLQMLLNDRFIDFSPE